MNVTAPMRSIMEELRKGPKPAKNLQGSADINYARSALRDLTRKGLVEVNSKRAKLTDSGWDLLEMDEGGDL